MIRQLAREQAPEGGRYWLPRHGGRPGGPGALCLQPGLERYGPARGAAGADRLFAAAGNDANAAAALAEALAGAAKGAGERRVVVLGTGVGSGVVLGGRLLTGYSGCASELGHMVIEEGGQLCACGRRGCF